MNTKFKRHQKVRILTIPNKEYIEYNFENNEDADKIEIKKGMFGEINMLLQNGKYHVEILNDKDEVVAYAPFEEESLEAA